MTFLPSGHSAVMASRREPPDSLDFFPTPPWATRALMRHVMPAVGFNPLDLRSVAEPACGEGHMAGVIVEFSDYVIPSDVFAYGYGRVEDFLSDSYPHRPEWLITNPPFKTAIEFTLKALEIATIGVAMLVRTQWIEGVDRYERLFSVRPPTLYAPFVERVPMVKGRWDPDASTATSYAWFVWAKCQAPRAPFWIPPGRRKELTMPDDRARFAAWSLEPKGEAPLLEAT